RRARLGPEGGGHPGPFRGLDAPFDPPRVLAAAGRVRRRERSLSPGEERPVMNETPWFPTLPGPSPDAAASAASSAERYAADLNRLLDGLWTSPCLPSRSMASPFDGLKALGSLLQQGISAMPPTGVPMTPAFS